MNIAKAVMASLARMSAGTRNETAHMTALSVATSVAGMSAGMASAVAHMSDSTVDIIMAMSVAVNAMNSANATSPVIVSGILVAHVVMKDIEDKVWVWVWVWGRGPVVRPLGRPVKGVYAHRPHTNYHRQEILS